MTPLPKKHKSKDKEPQVLEGFTYEELPEDNTKVEIPQEVIDNSIVIDMKDLQIENPEETQILDDAEVEPVKATNSGYEEKGTVTFTLPNIKETPIKPEKPEESAKKDKSNEEKLEELRKTSILKKRNLSRMVKLERFVVNTEETYIPYVVQPDYLQYANYLKKYMLHILLMNILKALQDAADLTTEQFTIYIERNINDFMKNLVDKILQAHKTVRSISGGCKVLTVTNGKGEDVIAISIHSEIIFPDHYDTYVSDDTIEIPV